MGNVGELVYSAEQHGEFYCEVCEETVELDGADGYDETREQILDHHERRHDDA